MARRLVSTGLFGAIALAFASVLATGCSVGDMPVDMDTDDGGIIVGGDRGDGGGRQHPLDLGPPDAPLVKMYDGGIPEQCMNGVQDPNETDIDCGGICPYCDVGKHCHGSDDCIDRICSGNVCVSAESCVDQMLNG